MEKIQKLKGANMDIDLLSNSKVSWKMGKCPWNESDKTNEHKCAIKNVSICKYFEGVEKLDTILCSYNKK